MTRPGPVWICERGPGDSATVLPSVTKPIYVTCSNGPNVYFFDVTAGDNDLVRAIVPVSAVRQQLAPNAWRYLANGLTSSQVNVDSGAVG